MLKFGKIHYLDAPVLQTAASPLQCHLSDEIRTTEIQQSKQNMNEHEKRPHEYFSSGVISALSPPLSRGSPSILVIMTLPPAPVSS